jgi:membrane-associated phospholipid phosphatase
VPARSRLTARIARFDARVDASFDRVRGDPLADRLFQTASDLGEFSLIWLLVGAARGLRSERDYYAAVRLGVALGIESALVNGLVKSLFRRTRPPWEMRHGPRLRRPRTSSFPSGHASAALTAAGLLSEQDPLWPLYYTAAVVVAASRVYVKVHHASDVLAGAAIGVVLARIGRKLAPLPESPVG